MPIGFFQFDNLLKQRVGFFIFSWVDLSVLGYRLMEKSHLEKITVAMNSAAGLSELKTKIQEQGLEKTAPIVLACQDGNLAQSFAQQLEAEGYLNVYWVLDGVQGLKQEKSAHEPAR